MSDRVNMLIVDRDKDHSTMFTTLFGGRVALEPRSCETTDDAVALLDSGFVPSLALVDDSVPGQSTSIDFCSDLKKRLPECVVFFMCAGERRTVVEKVRDSGVYDVLQKPFDFQFGIETVLAALGLGPGRNTIELTQYPLASLEQIEHLRTVLAEDPEDARVRQLLAFTLYMAQQFAEAAREYGTLAKEGHCTYLSEYYAGNAYARLHRYEQAVACWERAEKLAPRDELKQKIEARIGQARCLIGSDVQHKPASP